MALTHLSAFASLRRDAMGEGEVAPALGRGNRGLTVCVAADRNVRGPERGSATRSSAHDLK